MKSRIALALLALLLLPSLVSAQGVHTTEVDRLFARWNVPGSPGCAVAVAKDGREVLSRAYGLAELEHEVRNTPETVFEAGSVSKQFVAGAVVLLAEAGKLSLDDDVRKHVPELPRYQATITIRHLLNHTSGLRDWGTVQEAAGWPRTTRIHTHAHVLDVISRQKSLNYTPGEEYSYTNSGFNLLSIIAERVSGQSLNEFSKRNLFEPLGMRSTQWRDDFTRIVPDRADAYTVEQDGNFKLLMPFENVYGNGGLLTTVGDLLRWTANLESGRIGGPAFIAEMHRQARLNDRRQISYASGLRVSEYRGTGEVSHGGATAGYRAFLTRFPQQQLAVALLCNVTNANSGELAHQVADLFLTGVPRATEAPPAVELPAAQMAAVAGLYRNRRTHEPLRLEVSGGRLRVSERMELLPVSQYVFALPGSEDRFTFEVDDRSRPTVLRLRTEDGDEVEFEPVAPVSPTPAQLREYEGEYRSDEAGATYSAVVANGALELRLRPHRVIRLSPAYADAFTSDSGLLVRFTRDASGRVEQMSFGMGRVRDLRFTRMAR